MPGYRVHLVGGAVASAPFLYLLRSYSSPIIVSTWFLFALAGSLFPDLDTKSMGQKWFYRLIIPVFAVLLILKRFVLAILLILLAFTPLVVNHRGLFHRLWFVILPPVGIALALSWYFPLYAKDVLFAAAFFVIGIISHLVLDLGARGTFRW